MLYEHKVKLLVAFWVHVLPSVLPSSEKYLRDNIDLLDVDIFPTWFLRCIYKASLQLFPLPMELQNEPNMKNSISLRKCLESWLFISDPQEMECVSFL